MELGEVVVFSPRYNYATFYETEATKVGLNLEQCIHKPIQVVVPNRIGVQQIAIEVRDFYGESKTITKEINVVGDCESGIENIAEQSVSVYPNPASESITIAGENIAGIEICNLLGEVVYEFGRVAPWHDCTIAPRHDATNVISTENMPAGSYFVRVRMEDGKVVTKKIVVM
ncbi:MAG: T9SS type A sorting domain-containing protein, partial [Bacteroidales bacterium]|nr:T9SS type A sorting domain-containing protein [Bacteroidales bacterium]